MQRSTRSGHPAAQGTRQWKQLRTKFKAHCRALNALCWICVGRGDIEHAQIDYDAEPLRPLAFEADHFKPWSTHPYLAYEWVNLRASHVRCNRARRDEEATLVDAQREWVKPDW
jgi:hypothetical protein